MSDKRQQFVEAEPEKQRKPGVGSSSLENIMFGALNGAQNAIMDVVKETQKKSSELAEAASPLADNALKSISTLQMGLLLQLQPRRMNATAQSDKSNSACRRHSLTITVNGCCPIRY